MKDVYLQAEYTKLMSNGVEKVLLSPLSSMRPQTERDARLFTSWIAFGSTLVWKGSTGGMAKSDSKAD